MAIPATLDLRRISHAYLISAPHREDGLSTARAIAAAAVCAEAQPPCGLCRDCRKAAAGIHPDIITLGRLTDEKGREKKEIVVEQIRWLIEDAAIMPNEAKRKVYIIDQADAMNIPAQNAALKLLEEPPAGAVFLLCAENSQALLPTVRSRCVELICNGVEDGEDAESRKLAMGYLKAVATGGRAKLFSWCTANDSLDIRSASAFIDSADALASQMLCSKRDAMGLTGDRLFRLHGLLERCAAYLRVNTGVKHIFGLLAVDSIPAAETEES